MDDFFKSIYDHAQNIRALDFGDDREYRCITQELDSLAESFCPDDTGVDRLMEAVYALLYRGNVLSLSYGFRLGVRITAPDRL